MDNLVSQVVSAVLPHLEELTVRYPAWCGRYGVFPPVLARFSAAWSLEALIQEVLGMVPGWTILFSEQELIGGMWDLSVVKPDAAPLPVKLPPRLQARFIAVGLLTCREWPASPDKIRFDRRDPTLLFTFDSVNPEIANAVTAAVDVRELYAVILHSGRSRKRLREFWIAVGESVCGVVGGTRGSSGKGIRGTKLCELFDQGTALVRTFARWKTAEHRELLEGVEALQRAPLPRPWVSAPPTDPQALARYERSQRPEFVAMRLAFPMFRDNEIDRLWNARNHLKEHGGRLPARGLTGWLIGNRLGVAGSTVGGWMTEARQKTAETQ